ncbi:response regulator [Caulobacter sp. DWR1-3-2b1]|uniref:response regulator n=1 Tax=Caulobacter sp. DWR1-3-2b1 TaxID=2804670 RepID=UPI003CF4EEC9
MPDGGCLIVIGEPVSVQDDPELAAGDYVALSVVDDGPGMPETVKTRAFDPFFTTKGVGKGTGLGLAQVYGIAKQAEGVARIKSVLGGGTTVTLLLPRVEGEAVREQPAARPAPRAEQSGITILVVDDDRGVREFVCEALRNLGYDVTAASDGEEGLAFLEERKPDLAIIDFAMPGLNGAEVASRALALHPDLRILFASGYSDPDALNTSGCASARVLLKPFHVDALAETVAGVLRAKTPQ